MDARCAGGCSPSYGAASPPPIVVSCWPDGFALRIIAARAACQRRRATAPGGGGASSYDMRRYHR